MTHINNFKKRITRLDNLKDKLPEHIIEVAKKALSQGDNVKAEKLFTQIEELAALHILAAAEAAYQRGKIAENKINYSVAFNHYYRASQLASDNLIYLLEAGNAARNMANYTEEIKLTEQALKVYLKQDDKNPLNLARIWVNLGRAWKAKNEPDIAIGYYEKALNNYLIALDKRHPNVTICSPELGLNWKTKGEIDKVIGRYEKTLSILINVLSESHLDTQAVNDNLERTKEALSSVLI